MTAMDAAETWMREALALAERGRGDVEPNPMVGAVVVRDGRVVAGGYHTRFGGAHAEVEAFADCRRQGIDPAGTIVAVTLEPCCHHGKTPPCTDALIEASVARVIVAMIDPFEQVAGRGIATLRDAGIEVIVGVCEDEARRLNEPYLKLRRAGLPWVIAKWAQTLDGKIATATGDSQWISNDRSRRRVHELRARVDAIMVGVNTVVADDPELTARDVEVKRIAKRVVIDPNGRMPRHAKLATQTDPPVIVAVDVKQVLRDLADDGGANVLVEGGAALFGALFEQGLVDQVLAFVAPKLVGDADALDAVRGLSLPTIADAKQLELRHVERLGDDVLLDYRVSGAGDAR